MISISLIEQSTSRGAIRKGLNTLAVHHSRYNILHPSSDHEVCSDAHSINHEHSKNIYEKELLEFHSKNNLTSNIGIIDQEIIKHSTPLYA